MKITLFHIFCTFIILIVIGCDSNSPTGPKEDHTYDEILLLYPDFITQNEDYFITQIENTPILSADTYKLTVKGIGETELSFSLDDLLNLEMVEYPITIECIGNPDNGSRLSTAYWKGFHVYDFLRGIGMPDSVGGVKYTAEDGYFASHTLEQIKNNNVIGALFMNGVTIPREQGFPLRMIIPGYYGAKQPAWVTSIEILSEEDINNSRNDYWAPGWDVSSPIETDSKIFFPNSLAEIQQGESLAFGGAAYSTSRITNVEISIDSGVSWQETDIIKSIDFDNVWVYWYINLIFPEIGTYNVLARATDNNGATQQDRMPSINVIVNEKLQ
ncbi:molybdopterin-dependent oxidoreductase [Candidatus Latescibacterota bacterium]